MTRLADLMAGLDQYEGDKMTHANIAKERPATLQGFPLYVFWSDGSVVSHVRSKARMLKPIKMGQYVGLQILDAAGITQKQYLHRLICRAFHGEPVLGQQCRHLDGDRRNNRADNLAWGTPAENAADKIDHGTSADGERNPMAKLNAATVKEMRRVRAADGASYSALARIFNVSTMTAFRAVTRQSWRSL